MGRLSYFPPGIFSTGGDYDQSSAGWYAEHLTAMRESSLYMPADPEESYRFLWLRSFHHPLVIRVWRSAKGQFILVKRLSSVGVFRPGKLALNRTYSLTEGEWYGFINLLEKACYWGASTEGDVIGKDGARWILEGVREGRYHIVARWSPGGGDYREACLYLLKLSRSGIEMSGKEVY
jgi:hypothetical protein